MLELVDEVNDVYAVVHPEGRKSNGTGLLSILKWPQNVGNHALASWRALIDPCEEEGDPSDDLNKHLS